MERKDIIRILVVVVCAVLILISGKVRGKLPNINKKKMSIAIALIVITLFVVSILIFTSALRYTS